MKVYFISGLAADNRAFKYIKLPRGFEPEYLHWIPPKQNETLADYASRLVANISFESVFLLIGLSMGGMIASEISKKYKNARVIIVSSVPSSDYFPPHFRIVRKLKLYKFIPPLMIKTAAITKRLFTNESKEDKTILRAMIKESDNEFVKWAVSAVIEWENHELPSLYIHIHGTRDEMFPISFTRPTHVIKKGGHFMIMTHYNEINKILEKELPDLAKE